MCRRAAGACLALLVACKGKSEQQPIDPTVGSADVNRVEQALGEIVATCAEVNGTVEVRRKGKATWEKVAVGSTLRERDWIRTADGSFARVRFGDRGYLDLRAQTTILVDTAISVESGTIDGLAQPGAQPIVMRAKDGSEARIVAAAAGQPAMFRVTPIKGDALEIAATKGDISVKTKGGERTVPAGKATNVANHATTDVVSLLEFPRSIAPGIDARFMFVTGQSIQLSWQAVKLAHGYQVQVARDTEFHQLVVNVDAAATTIPFTPTVPGLYAWRVAARDASERLGEYGFARRMYVELETPRDLLLSPAEGAKVGFSDSYPKIEFSWQPLGDVPQYKLVINNSAMPNGEPVVTLTTTAQKLEVGSLREGTYRWGVYAIRDGREEPIFLTARELTVRRQRVKAHTENLWEDSDR